RNDDAILDETRLLEIEPDRVQQAHIGIVRHDAGKAIAIIQDAVIVPFLDAVPGRANGRAAVAFHLLPRPARLDKPPLRVQKITRRQFPLHLPLHHPPPPDWSRRLSSLSDL